jgi:hypothetical protein
VLVNILHLDYAAKLNSLWGQYENSQKEARQAAQIQGRAA